MHRVLFPTIVLLLAGTVLVSQTNLSAQTRPAPPKEKSGAASADDRAELLRTVGLLSAAQVYQGYLNIGFLADGMANGNYDAKDAEQVIESILQLLDASDRRLEKVTDLDLTKADREALVHVRKLSGLVRQQGLELKAFWKTGAKEQGDRYEKTRLEAWEGISKLLKLEKKDEK
jgi:hypothetical protein